MTRLSPNILQLYRAQADYTIYGVQWIPQSARLLTVGMAPRGAGVVSVWDFEQRRLVEQTRREHPAALKCVTFGASLAPARHFATGDHAGALLVFDVERLGAPAYAARAHAAMVHCVDGLGGRNPAAAGAPEIATGGADGAVRLFDVRQAAPVLELTASEASTTRQQVGRDMHLLARPEAWTVALGGAASHAERLLAAGFDSGDFKLLDLRMMRVRYERHFANGVVSAEFDRPDAALNKIQLGTLEGHVYTLDFAAEEPAVADARPTGDAATVWQVRHSPFDRDLAAVAAADRVLLARYERPAERVVGGRAVAGRLAVVAEAVVAQQTCPSLCWSREKRGLLAWGALDQSVGVGFATNLAQFD